MQSLAFFLVSFSLEFCHTEMYDEANESQSFLSTSKSSYDASKLSSDEIFPDISLNLSSSSETRLSHAAAKHKMAVRPKKKGRPTRRAVEVSFLIE